MNHHQPDPRLTLAALHANTLAARLPQALRLAKLQALDNDGYPHTASGADTNRGAKNSIGRPTEQAALAATNNTNDTGHTTIDYLHALANGVLKTLTELAREIDKLLGPGYQKPAQCDGRGLEGFPDWGDACDRPADKAGLCHKHYMRCYRWRNDHNLPPLRDTAA